MMKLCIPEERGFPESPVAFFDFDEVNLFDFGSNIVVGRV